MSTTDRSLLGHILLGAALAGATGACLYVLLKSDEDENDREGNYRVTINQHSVDVHIKRENVGGVIGKQGCNIREIQSRTNTRLYFRDELDSETHRVLQIKGLPDDVQLAELLIQQSIAGQARVESSVIYLPADSVGSIIGRNGENVRAIQRKAGCKIDIERREDSESLERKVTIRGSSQQIETAKSIIQEQLDNIEFVSEKIESFKIPGPERIKYRDPLFLKYDEDDLQPDVAKTPEQEDLMSCGSEYVNVFVSSVANPSFFWVQNVGPSSIALDKLTDEMTTFYEESVNQEMYRVTFAAEGDLIATTFSGDDKYYRGKVVKFTPNEYDPKESMVTLDFVDFGDFEEKVITEVYALKDEFLRLKLQAIACSLSNIKPVGGEWSEEAIDHFETLSRCAQWQQVTVKLSKSGRGQKKSMPFGDGVATSKTKNHKGPIDVELLVTSPSGGDTSVGVELIRLGYAQAVPGPCSP